VGDSYDFYSPFVSAALISPKGERVPLWTNILDGSGGGKNVDATKFTAELTRGLVSFPFLESLTIELNLSYLPRMVAVLTPPMRDAQKFLESPLVEWGQSTLQAIIGYSSGTESGAVLSEPFEALVLKPDISLGVDSTITLNAQGVAGYDATVAQAPTVHNNKSRRQILIDTAAGVGTTKRALEMDFEDVDDLSKVEAGTAAFKTQKEAKKLLDQTVTVSQGWKTDWMFMLQIARDARCWLGLGQDGNTVTLFPIGGHLASAPKYTLRFFDFVGGRLGPKERNDIGATSETENSKSQGGDFPILAVSSPSSSVWLPGATKALVTSGIESSTGKTVTKVYNEKNAAPEAATGGGATQIASNPNQPGADPKTGLGGAPLAKNINFKDTDAAAKSAFATDFKMGIKLQVTTLGMPRILPGDVVAIRGVGARFDWNYGVFQVRHNIGASGFTTELELISNTSAILASLVPTDVPINDKPVEPDAIKVVAKPQPGFGGRNVGA